jgi:hypothetical protein
MGDYNKDLGDICIEFIGKIFRQAAQDIRYGNEEVKQDALDFLDSDYFEILCSWIPANPSRVRTMILNMDNSITGRS